jgi:hypothetical protein
MTEVFRRDLPHLLQQLVQRLLFDLALAARHDWVGQLRCLAVDGRCVAGSSAFDLISSGSARIPTNRFWQRLRAQIHREEKPQGRDLSEFQRGRS